MATRTALVRVRLLAEEKAQLERTAKSRGQSLSNYVRDLLFDATYVPLDAPEPDQKFSYPNPHAVKMSDAKVVRRTVAAADSSEYLPGLPARKLGRNRSEMCEHRVPADRYCKTCD